MSGRRGDSKGDAGTHDGAMKNTSSWSPDVASSSQWTPSTPSTLAISCGSATTAVVPSGSTSRANSSTMSFTDSRCMCASISPGTTYRPLASRVSRPSYVAESRDDAVDDRDVRLEPLAREHREDAPAPDDEVGGLVATGHREPTLEHLHGASLVRPGLRLDGSRSPRSGLSYSRLGRSLTGDRRIR